MKPSLIQYRALQRAGALYLKLISDEIYVSKSKQTASFEISSNTTWDITDIPEWITIGTEDINNNTGNKIISIEISANSLYSYRAHELVIVSSNKALTTKVPITQLGTLDIPYLNILVKVCLILHLTFNLVWILILCFILNILILLYI